jgi:hypothetical protein
MDRGFSGVYEVKGMKGILYESFPYVAMLLVCVFNARNIINGTDNTFMRKYRKLTDEEKELYDSWKVKVSQLLYVLCFGVLTVFAFVFSVVFPDVIRTEIFIGGYVVEVVLLLILSETRLVLDGFCRKG